MAILLRRDKVPARSKGVRCGGSNVTDAADSVREISPTTLVAAVSRRIAAIHSLAA
jgi:hypothetical protein